MTINEFKAISLEMGAGNVNITHAWSNDNMAEANWDGYYSRFIPSKETIIRNKGITHGSEAIKDIIIDLFVSKDEVIEYCKAAIIAKSCKGVIELTKQDFKNILKFAIDNKPKKMRGEYQYNQIGFYSHNGKLYVAKFFENDKQQDEINVLETNAIFNSNTSFDLRYSEIIPFLQTMSKLKINKVDKWQISIYDTKVKLKFGVTNLELPTYLPYKECNKLLDNYVSNKALSKELNTALNNALEFGKDKDDNTIWINNGNLMATNEKFFLLQNLRDYVDSEINTNAFHLTKKIKTKDEFTIKDNNLYCNGKLLVFNDKAKKTKLKCLAKTCNVALQGLENKLYKDKTQLVKIVFNSSNLLELRHYLHLFSFEVINNALIIKNTSDDDRDDFQADTYTNIAINKSNGSFKFYVSSKYLISFINACKQEIKDNLMMTLEYNKLYIKMTIGNKIMYVVNYFKSNDDDSYVNVNEVKEQAIQSNDEIKDDSNDATSNNPYRIGLAISLSRVLNGYVNTEHIYRLINNRKSLKLQNERGIYPYTNCLSNEAKSHYCYNLAIS